MKTLVAGLLMASAVALTAPTPAAALGIHIGPRGVGVRLGHPGWRRGWHRPFVHRRWHHDWRHGWRGHWHR